MITIKRTDSNNIHFIELVRLLDAELEIRDGDEHDFYNQFNAIDTIKYAVVIYFNSKPVACGALKKYAKNVVEIKRIYTLPEFRGKGMASKILNELEKWASELSYKKCILETGINQPEAQNLYKKNGYKLIPNYEPYTNAKNSFCFEKAVVNS